MSLYVIGIYLEVIKSLFFIKFLVVGFFVMGYFLIILFELGVWGGIEVKGGN